MGNDSSKQNGAGRFGQIFVQTDKSVYLGGETVTGRVYLNLLIPYPGNQLFLKLKGRELVQIVTTTQETRPVQRENINTTEFYDKHTLHQEKNDVIKMTVPIYTWSNLLPGQYTIPFAFMLPTHCPSSFHQQGYKYLANVSYQLEAILEPALKSDLKLKYKQPFVVRQPVTNAQQSQVAEINTEVKACCTSKGSNVLKVNFEKNYYAPGETAQVHLQLDNSLSTANNSKIVFALKQKLWISAKSASETKEFTKVTRELPGIQAGAAGNSDYVSINLPIFTPTDYRDIDRKNTVDTLVKYQDEQGLLNPATKSRSIKSEYFLEVSCPMDGCCANAPIASIPIEIYYPEIKLAAISTPPNWHPQIIQSVNISFGGVSVSTGFQQTGFQQQNTMEQPKFNSTGFQQTGFQEQGQFNSTGFQQTGYQPPNQF